MMWGLTSVSGEKTKIYFDSILIVAYSSLITQEVKIFIGELSEIVGG